MSNFIFLKNEWPRLFSEAKDAEHHTYTSPKASCFLARRTLEFTVNWLYANDPDLTTPYNTRLGTLMHENCFKEILPPNMFYEIDAIRRAGNSAAHGGRITQYQSLLTIKNLYRFLKFFCEIYARKVPAIAPFDETLIPDGKEAEKSKQQLQELQQQLEKERSKQQEEIELLQQKLADKDKQLLEQRQQVQKRKTERKSKCPLEKISPMLVSEQETRALYIDLLLKESGWDNLREGYELEHEVTGMPKNTNPSGKGYVDYVLWGDNGKPLAVIEAKNAMQNVKKGKHQAELYATCLEQKHQQRPIIFYTNGFETYMWDEAFYPEREVQGFYSKDELQLLINRRNLRRDLRDFTPDKNIVDRHYQIEAVKRVAESMTQTHNGTLRGKSRQSLLVMATGSGKTRTAAAIVDMFVKCDWVKRVLFLADRNALVTQAKNAFNELLPHLSAIDLTKEKEDNGTRLVFSTYPTIMNKIDDVKSDGNRFYGVGHFDLVIIDEAHRSVYRKYSAIFEYFDSLLIGLTATPKTEIDRNTYQLFHIDDNDPTFAYELEEAVKDKYLVPYKAISVPLKFQREGIKYNELSKEDQRKYEEQFGDPTTGEFSDEISSPALNTWLFNSDTVDKVLEHLMNHGIKVEGGDKIGKTIIFAKNCNHAEFIEKRFDKRYPEYGSKFLRKITHGPKSQSLLDKFTDKASDNDPQIAVSVDMMDTGVDAPRVVNLVFFKLVRSISKFQQMIGRGTRLCPNLFGPGEDKTHFLIFDFCQNFEFFDENPEGIEGNTQKSLAQRIFEAKLEVATLIRNKEQKITTESELAEKYIDELHKAVVALDSNRFVVKKENRYVTKYKEKSQWQNLSRSDIQELYTHISHLMLPIKNDHELARRFDLLILNLQRAVLAETTKEKYIVKVYNTAQQLNTKENIPSVKKHMPLIEEIQQDIFWERVHPSRLEEVRVALRELIHLIDRESQTIYYTTFTDEIHEDDIIVRESTSTYSTLKPYHERVESYIHNHRNHIVIQKLNTNKPITSQEIQELERILFDGEERGTKNDYIKHYGDRPLGEFIRSIVGLDVGVAKEAFAEFLQKGNLRADQMTFVNSIITYLTKNGMIDKGMLFEPPFTDINDQGLLGVFDDAEAHNIIQIIDRVNGNAVAL